MSAVVGEPAAGGSQKYVNFDEYVDFQVNKTRAGIRYTDLLLAVVTVLLVVAGYLLLFVVADQWLIEGGFNDWTRIGLLAGVVGFIGFWTTWKIILPYWKRVTALYAAKELEGTQPQLKSSLLTLVDLKQAGRAVSPHILTAMEKRAALQLSQVDVEQAVDRRPLMRLAYALLGVVVALCLYTVLSPKPVGASLLRALIPVADIGVATRTQITKVDPGATSILARSQLEVTVDVKGEIPPEATLLYTTHDRSLVDEAIVLRDTGEGLNRFRGTLAGPNGRGLLQDFTYRIVAGDAESESFPVSVKQAPYATVESVTYTYPQYMGLDPQTQSGGDIEAWEGTKVTLRGVTNMPVAAATLKFHDTEDISVKAEELPLRLVDSTHFELTWPLQFRRDGTFARFYQVDLRTDEGQRDPVPRLYGQNLRRDLPPEVKLLHPSGDMDLPSNAVLPISFAARDPDFMLRSIRLKFEHREMPLEAKTRHLYDAPPYQPEYQGQGEIRLSDFESVVKPGDVLTFYLEAWDNMAPLDREGNRSVTPKINIRITPEETKEEVEQRREEQAQAAQERLDEAQSQQSPAQGETEPSPEGASGESEATEPSAEESQPTEPGDIGEQNANEPQPGEQATGSESSTAPQNAEPPETQTQEGAQQQPQQGEKTPDGSQQQESADGGKSGQPSKTGKTQSSPSGTGEQQKSANEQAGSQPGAQQKGSQSQPKPGEEASDDEALAKLLNKYKDEIKQQREQEQQQQQQEDGSDPKSQQGNESQQGSQSSANKPQQKSSGDQGSEGSDLQTGESNETGKEKTESSEGSRSRTDGTKPDDANNAEQQNKTGDDGEQKGDPGQSDNPEKQQNQPGEQQQPGEKPQTPGSKRDPRESQDPRATEQAKSQTGKPQPKSDNGEPQQGTGEQEQPMTGESDSSQSTSPSDQQSKGSGSPSEDPSSEKPASEGGEKPEGDAGRPSNEDAQQNGEPEQSGANDPNASKPSKTGDQPKGANEQNPGEGRKDGQRSDQPQTGEKGSSQQTTEGQKSNESGTGEASDSPGSQSEGAEGQSSPGEGKQAGDKPGQPKSGSGSKSQPGQSGSEGSESGDPQQSGSEGSEGAQGAEQKSESKPQAGEKPGSKADSGKPENKGKGQQGRSEESPMGDEKPGESGASGEKPSGEGEKSGNEPSGSGGGEKPQGNESGEKPSDSGGGKKPGSKPQGDKPEGGGEQGSESKGSGEQQGSESSGSEGGGSESGSESGGGKSGEGEPGEGSSSSSSDPGNSQQTGKPGSGQAAGGQVGAGGRGTNEGPVPPGSGGQGNAEAGPAEPADLRDKKKATELVLQKLQDEISRGEVSPELLQDLGWTEQNLRDFMDRLDRRLSDTGEDESPEATARRRQFDEILRGIDYESEGTQKIYDNRDRQVEAGAGPIPRLPAPSEFRRAEESMRQKLSRETKSKK